MLRTLVRTFIFWDEDLIIIRAYTPFKNLNPLKQIERMLIIIDSLMLQIDYANQFYINLEIGFIIFEKSL